MSANVAAVCTSAKLKFLEGGLNLTSGAKTLKAALYYQNSSLGAATTAYSTTGEVSGAGYTAGGVTVTNGTSPTTSGSTAYWTPTASFSWSGLTIASAFDAVLIYDATDANAAIAVYTFPAQTASSATFALQMPANGVGTALLQMA